MHEGSIDKSIVTNGVEHGSLNLILNHYYDERGWDTESGVPKEENLVVLGLHEIADDIENNIT